MGGLLLWHLALMRPGNCLQGLGIYRQLPTVHSLPLAPPVPASARYQQVIIIIKSTEFREFRRRSSVGTKYRS
jgi:hypothetical protein